MEENISLPENALELGETKLVSDPSPQLVETSPNLADLRPVQSSLNGLPETKASLFDKMDVDNHNVAVDNSADSEIHEPTSLVPYPITEDEEMTESDSVPIDTISEQVVITETNSVSDESIHLETTDTNCLSSKSISELSEITDTSSPPCESISEHTLTNSVPDLSEHSELPEKKPLLDDLSASNSPQITPGQSRYGRIRRPKLSVDFVSVDKKSFAVLNSSSYDFLHAEESRSATPPLAKKKRSYNRKSSVLPKSDSTPTTPNLTPEPLGQSSKAETAESKTELSITTSDVYPLDESSISSLNSGTIKTYSRLSEAGLSSDDKLGGTEDSAKESMPVNYTELNWKVGDVAWAKVGCYPYWPSIVTLEYGSSIYAKSIGKRGNRLAVHVQFFGDRGRRSWVLTTSLIKYESKEQFLELKRQYKKDKIRNKYFNVLRMKELWEKAIAEADTILKLPHEERIQYYQSIYPQSEETYAEKVSPNKVKSPIRSLKEHREERRGRKRKILDEPDNRGLVKKKKKMENFGSISATQRGSVMVRRGRGRPPKKMVSSMEEHLRKRRAFEKRLKKLMTPAGDEKKQKKAGKSGKSQKPVSKFDQLVKNEKLVAAAGAPKDETKKKDALSVYDFESDEETDVFLGTYNSRYTPHLLAKIEEKKSDEVEVAETPTSSTDMGSIEEKPSDETDEKAESNDAEVDIKPEATKEESATKIDAEVGAKRGRGRPKGSKNVKTLLKLQALQKKRGKSGLTKNQAQGKLGIRRKKKAFFLKAEHKILKKQPSETNDGKDSTSEQTKKVHPKKRLLEKSRRSEKPTENAEEPEKTSSDESVKLNKPSPSMSPKEDLDSDDDVQPDAEEEKGRSSSPQPVPYKSKKSCALFKCFKSEKVCLICEKAGDTVRCRGPCSGTYHIECVTPAGTVEVKKVEVKKIEVVDHVAPCKPRRGRPPRVSSANLVSASESKEVANPIASSASSDESHPDQNPDRENCSSANVDSVTQTATSQVDISGLSKDDSFSESVRAENECGAETNVSVDEEASTQTTTASVPSLESEEVNDDHPTDEMLPVTELTNSVIESNEASVMNGHCDLLGGGDATMHHQATINHSVEERTESGDAKEITQELDVPVVNHLKEADEFSSIKEVPNDSSLSLNEKSEVCNDQTVDDSVTSSGNVNEQAEEQRLPNGVEADHSLPDSSNMSDNEAIDSTPQNCIEDTNQTTGANASDENVEEPSSSTSNDLVEEHKSPDLRNAEESVNFTDVDQQVDEPDSCCDSMNPEPAQDGVCCDATGNSVEESVCDVVVKDEASAVPVSLLENEEAASSDGCSENLGSKTDGLNGIDFRCARCSENKLYPCFTCGQDVEEKTGEAQRYSCYLSSCGRVYHKECLKNWPQATWKDNFSGRLVRNGSSVSRSAVIPKETLLCPQHYCHTCISENPAVHKNRHCNEILVRCIRCPTAYHRRVHCIPAGTEILTMSQIICPRHYEPPVGAKNVLHFNTSWCFICCIGGSLICCDECPTSFHAECLQLRPEEYEGRYICDDCQSGRYLLYGDIAWVKLGQYRWWPAKILYSNEVPENIQQLPHRRGEFVVQFYGSHNYNWVNRGRAFLYQEGDSGKKSCGKSCLNQSFVKAIQEAEAAYEKLKIDKAARDEEARLGWKPPKYVHIKANKPVGNVRIVELNSSNITPCECDPQSERPCGPDSDCINRMLLVECNPLVCPAGDRCYNQMFEKRIYPPLMPYNTDKRGWGLKTLVDLKKGDFIIEYVGEMIDEEEYKRRVNIMHKNQEDNYYFLTIDKDRMLDAGPKGNVARFMNHSCDPNCETQKWTVNGDTRVGLFAFKDIPANTELVFNYNLSTQGNEMKPCFCGSENCSGFIGVKAAKNGGSSVEDEQRKRSEECEKVKRRRGRPKKKIRKRILTSKESKPSDDKPSTEAPQRPAKPKIRKKVIAKKAASRFNKWSVANPRFKNKTRLAGVGKKNVKSLLKHREELKQRTMAQDAQPKVTPPREKKVVSRGRPKTPKTEEEKQALLFEMMRRRIQRKFEEMTLCKLDEKCFVCGESQEDEELLFCDNNKCPKGYHLQCVDLAKWPSGRWLCPWHYCSVCRSIRKVLKCDRCTNSYCFLHLSGNMFKENTGSHLCQEHRTADSELLQAMPKLEKNSSAEPADTSNATPDVPSPTPESSTTPAKKARGRPKGSKVATRYVEPSTIVEEVPHVVAIKRIKKMSAKMAEANGLVSSASSSSPKSPKVKRKVLTKKRPAPPEQPSPGGQPPRKKFKKKKKLPNGDLEGSRLPGKLVVEANVKFEMMGSDKPEERLSDDERLTEAAASVSTPTKTNANDSDSSYVASEVMVVDEVVEPNTSKEASELSDAAGTDDQTPAADTSDDEYTNLEVEVVNGEDSN